EKEEWDELYPAFAKAAREEGFPEVAAAYMKIIEVEKRHETRYNKLAENVANSRVFEREQPVQWICMKCGYVYTGKTPPKVCPACLNPQSYFELFVENY
ncbi:MAG TPA: rubrerythrin family protein, partial [Clostridiales bacterium]|nr:rubrerythrin family protein [Clostridiales bacterium]